MRLGIYEKIIGCTLAVSALTFGPVLTTQAINESRGRVYLSRQSSSFESRMAYKSENSSSYNMIQIQFMATPRGGIGVYSRPINYEEKVEAERIYAEREIKMRSHKVSK